MNYHRAHTGPTDIRFSGVTFKMLGRSLLLLLSLAFALPCELTSADEPDARQKARADLEQQRQLAEAGPEHARLKKLVGDWSVAMVMKGKSLPQFSGTAKVESILNDRFLVIDGNCKFADQPSAFRYHLGFDRRHGEYTIILMDTAGTYFVSARGKPGDDRIRMFGTDDDPRMKQMGFGTKQFAFDLDITSDDEFSIATVFIDTRTEENKPIESFRHTFKRNGAGR